MKKKKKKAGRSWWILDMMTAFQAAQEVHSFHSVTKLVSLKNKLSNTSYYRSAFFATKASQNSPQNYVYFSFKKKKSLRHFLCPVRSYRTVSIGFSGNIALLTGKVKYTRRQKDSRVCNKYLLSAWQNSQTWVRQVRRTSNKTRKLSGNFIHFIKETSHSLQVLSDLVFKHLGST